MSNLSLIERSSEILTKYYENDIQPFLDAMHPEILWIGPAENQIIPGKARLEAAFRAEQNTLHFELHDLGGDGQPARSGGDPPLSGGHLLAGWYDQSGQAARPTHLGAGGRADVHPCVPHL